MKRATLIFAIILLTNIAAKAQITQASSVPLLINYQGMLADASGNPLAGTKKLTFNIYDAAVGGNLVWGPQVFDSVPLVNGRFNVILGTTDTNGNLITDAFDSKDRYLGIKVESNPEIAPRQQVLSTPFALQAEWARHGVPAGTILPYGGNPAPEGFLKCNGDTVSRTTYSSLFIAIGTAWGAGDGSTTFHLPDLRGRFLRGVDEGTGRDPDAVSRTESNNGGNVGDNVGSVQIDQFKEHDHKVLADGSTATVGWGLIVFSNPLIFSVTGKSDVSGGLETRPRNVSVNFIIKY